LSNTEKKLLELVVKALDDKRAQDIVALDMSEISIVTDYNVITHGSSSRQIGALAQSVVDEANKNGYEINRIEGKGSNKWILIDLGSIVVHIFNQEERDFFKLESLWTEAITIDIQDWIVE